MPGTSGGPKVDDEDQDSRRSLLAQVALALASILVLLTLAVGLHRSCQVALLPKEPSVSNAGGLTRLQWKLLQPPPVPVDIRTENLVLMRALRDVFQKYEVQYWLEGAALLGAARQGRTIVRESGVAMGVLAESLRKLRHADSTDFLQPLGVWLQVQRSEHHSKLWTDHPSWIPEARDEAAPIRAYHMATGRYVDVAVFERVADTAEMDDEVYPPVTPQSQRYLQSFTSFATDSASAWWMKGNKYANEAVRVPEKTLLPTQTCPFEGEDFQCPGKTDTYIEDLYGAGVLEHSEPSSVCATVFGMGAGVRWSVDTLHAFVLQLLEMRKALWSRLWASFLAAGVSSKEEKKPSGDASFSAEQPPRILIDDGGNGGAADSPPRSTHYTFGESLRPEMDEMDRRREKSRQDIDKLVKKQAAKETAAARSSDSESLAQDWAASTAAQQPAHRSRSRIRSEGSGIDSHAGTIGHSDRAALHVSSSGAVAALREPS